MFDPTKSGRTTNRIDTAGVFHPAGLFDQRAHQTRLKANRITQDLLDPPAVRQASAIKIGTSKSFWMTLITTSILGEPPRQKRAIQEGILDGFFGH